MIFNEDQIDRFMRDLVTTGRPSAAGIAIVYEGEIQFARDYDEPRIARHMKPSADVRFPIGSTAKAMTAALVGMLADDGTLDFDAPLQTYMPAFTLHDAEASRQTTIRDLLSMRTGLPRHDWVWMGQNIGPTELIRRLRHLHPTASHRDRFQYNNIGYMVAALLAERLTGVKWAQLAKDRLFQPLGLSGTNFDLLPDQTVVGFHEDEERRLVPSPPLNDAIAMPAGALICSTLGDMCRWIAFNLARGQFGGRQLLTSRTFQSLQTPHIAAGADTSAPSAHAQYALGWFEDRFESKRRISHTGLTNGVQTSVMLAPDNGFGLVSYVNFAPSRLAPKINEAIWRTLTCGQAPSVDRSVAAYDAQFADARERLARFSPAAPAALCPEPHAGIYHNPGYGELQVRRQAGCLVIRRGAYDVKLTRKAGDFWCGSATHLFEPHRPHPFDCDNGVQFFPAAGGQASRVAVRYEPSAPAIEFSRRDP